jgi:hypothetical protein
MCLTIFYIIRNAADNIFLLSFPRLRDDSIFLPVMLESADDSISSLIIPVMLESADDSISSLIIPVMLESADDSISSFVLCVFRRSFFVARDSIGRLGSLQNDTVSVMLESRDFGTIASWG